MKTIRVLLACSVAVALLPGRSMAVVIGQIDTFQSGTTEGWFAGISQVPPVPPQVFPAGGPAGANDAFLVVTSGGGMGPGSRLVAMNGTQWTGNFLSPGIAGICMDLNNLGATDLEIRLLFENPVGGPPTDEAISTAGASLAPGSGWVHAFFPLDPSAFTATEGTVAGALSSTTILRIIHSTSGLDSDPIAGVLGIDNIEACAVAPVPEPATMLLVGVGAAALALRRKR
jgi:hypothetical protein